MNKEVACRKIMKVTNITHIQNVEKYLVYLKINGLVKQKICNYKFKKNEEAIP